MTWFTENLGTVIVLLIVAAISGFASYSLIKKRKNGGGCSCGCGGCPMSGACHSEKKKNTPSEDSENK